MPPLFRGPLSLPPVHSSLRNDMVASSLHGWPHDKWHNSPQELKHQKKEKNTLMAYQLIICTQKRCLGQILLKHGGGIRDIREKLGERLCSIINMPVLVCCKFGVLSE